MVVGASRGLGFQLSDTLAQRGAKLAVVARQADGLHQATQRLASRSPELLPVVGDVSAAGQAETIVGQVVERFGQLDAVFHCVGKSMRGRLLDVTQAQLSEAWQSNVATALEVARAAVPQLATRRGHFVAIGSLSSKTASPHMAAYPLTKAALAMFCHQLRLEWEPQGLHVLLVCPGPIARPDAGSRYAATASDLPLEAQKPGGGVRLRGIDSARLSAQILQACERRRAELVVPGKARWLFALQQLAPSWGDRIVRRKTSGPS